MVRKKNEGVSAVRRWYKYQLAPAAGMTRVYEQDENFRDHALSMGGYDADESYASRDQFFDRHYFNAAWGRYESYDRFLRSVLNKKWKILSVGSGRAINELVFINEGYDVTCSDLEVAPCVEAARILFPNLVYKRLNILRDPDCGFYDAVVSLSLIYLFDADELTLFFRNVALSLKEGGHFILDSAGAPDNVLSYLWRDVCLPLETRVKQLIGAFQGHKRRFSIKRFGYVRTDQEIVSAAARAGLRLADSIRGAYLMEFRRSSLIGRLIGKAPWLDGLLSVVGSRIPYIRMFHFVKDGNLFGWTQRGAQNE